MNRVGIRTYKGTMKVVLLLFMLGQRPNNVCVVMPTLLVGKIKSQSSFLLRVGGVRASGCVCVGANAIGKYG